MQAGFLPSHMSVESGIDLRAMCGCLHTPDTHIHTHCMLHWACDYSVVMGARAVMSLPSNYWRVKLITTEKAW